MSVVYGVLGLVVVLLGFAVWAARLQGSAEEAEGEAEQARSARDRAEAKLRARGAVEGSLEARLGDLRHADADADAVWGPGRVLRDPGAGPPPEPPAEA